jgi:hypothetical protein
MTVWSDHFLWNYCPFLVRILFHKQICTYNWNILHVNSSKLYMLTYYHMYSHISLWQFVWTIFIPISLWQFVWTIFIPISLWQFVWTIFIPISLWQFVWTIFEGVIILFETKCIFLRTWRMLEGETLSYYLHLVKHFGSLFYSHLSSEIQPIIYLNIKQFHNSKCCYAN